jgi:hypothetical protein
MFHVMMSCCWWSIEEEREFQKLAKEKNSIELVAGKLKKTQKAVYMRFYTLALDEEEETKTKLPASSSSQVIEKIKKEIPTPGEALRLLVSCMQKLVLLHLSLLI